MLKLYKNFGKAPLQKHKRYSASIRPMRLFATILAFGLLGSCSYTGHVGVDSIKIVKAHQHPTLADHDRKLVTVDKNHRIIDELDIYPDSGDGCEAFLFDAGLKYLLIDCNGQWFSIGKATGVLKNEGWKWNEKLPGEPLGKFKKPDKGWNYFYLSRTNFNEHDVYKYKDPG